MKHQHTFPLMIMVAVIPLIGGCMDMFDPSGGSYARNRYVDSDAFALRETRATSAGVTYVFSARKPTAKIKLRSVYLFSDLTLQKRNGPHLKFDWDGYQRVEVAVSKDDVAKYSGITIFGDYQTPEEAIAGARSVNIAQQIYFSDASDQKPNKAPEPTP